MIVLNLQCAEGHAFEGWFASADAFETQNAAGLVACPHCGDTTVHRTPTAPYVHAQAAQPKPPAKPPSPQALVARLRAAARRAEDVGRKFPEEARKIHYGEAPERGIRGQASGEQIAELIDEGIAVLPVPPDNDLH